MSELKDIPLGAALSTYFSWTVLFSVGHIRDFLAALLWGNHNQEAMGAKPGYAPLRQDYEDFYTRRAYSRVIECFSRPVSGPPDRVITVVMRHQAKGLGAPVPTGEHRPCINLGSYNYLGFANQVICSQRYSKRM
jgi:serine palmitoyltransferase